MLVTFAVAAQLAIVAQAPDTIATCDAIDVSVAVSSPASGPVPRLLVPSFRPFDILRSASGPQLHMSGASVTSEYRFMLTTDRAGHFIIPAFEAVVGGERVRSQPLSIVVRPARTRGRSIVVARARIDTSLDISLRALAAPETVFVGQQATYEVAVFLNQAARERLRRNPTFYPPDMQAVLAYDLPSNPPGHRVGSQCFDALVYRRALFPLVAGRLVIPPAQLVYSTGLSSFYNREESHELQTDSVMIVAVDPPLTGRPVEYAGAVGDIRLDAALDSDRARVGDPMLFTVRVAGSGNVKLFPRPNVAVSWAGLVPADERVRVDSTTVRIGGVKEFDWVLTPRIAGEFDVPRVRYGYFDPTHRSYGVAATPEARVHIAAGALASADTGHVDTVLPIRTRYGGPAWPTPQSRAAFWLVMALVPVPAIASRARRRVRRVREARYDPIRALAQTPWTEDPAKLRRAYVRIIGERVGCNPEDFTRPGALSRVLRHAGVSQETAARAESLLGTLDLAAYTRSMGLPRDAAREAATIARAIDSEALARAELPFWVPVIACAMSLGVAASAIAAATASPASSFARGVSSYIRQDYATARAAFADAATLAPNVPDAWANYGTASWSAGDTAAAVLGWRQALAIQPDADDLQYHIELARDLGPLSPGWVPALPRALFVYVFAILWIAGWTFAWMARRPHPWARRLPVPILASALLIGLMAIELETRVSGRNLAVVRGAAALLSDPAIGVDRGPTVGTGEIVRVVGRRATWARVEASEDRDGWIASSQLLFLADRRP